jgi:hypothetical protein
MRIVQLLFLHLLDQSGSGMETLERQQCISLAGSSLQSGPLDTPKTPALRRLAAIQPCTRLVASTILVSLGAYHANIANSFNEEVRRLSDRFDLYEKGLVSLGGASLMLVTRPVYYQSRSFGKLHLTSQQHRS